MHLKELEDLVQQLEHKLKSRGRLADELAHEIKNPISAILCSAQALELLIGDKFAPAHRRCVRYIREYGENVLQLVTDFLDFSRAEAQLLKSDPEVMRVWDVIDAVLGLLRGPASGQQIALMHDQPNQELYIFCDVRQLKQAIFNLVHNAAKFTGSGTTVTVRVTGDEETVRITVADQGPGVPEHLRSQIFEPYRRDEDNRASGVGLGLSVVRALVALNHGSVRLLESTSGASFEISIPRCTKPTAVAAAAEESNSEAPLEGRRVLLLHSDEHMGGVMAQLIQAWGGMVDQVSEAADALRALEAVPYDAVMLDRPLEKESERRDVSRIASQIKSTDAQLIVAVDSKQECQVAQALGACTSLERPLNGKDVLDSLKALK